MTWKRFENEPTDMLISIAQDRNGLENDADDAFSCLTFRFRSDVAKKCEMICKRFGHDINVATIIAEQVFVNYEKSRNFDLNESNTNNIDDAFRFYLYSIARRALTSYYRVEQRKKEGKYYDGTEKIVTELPTDVDVNKLPDLTSKVIYEAINNLPYHQIVVYLTYKKYEVNGATLPRHLLVKLREHLGDVTQSTIRSYKRDANKFIEAYIAGMKITRNEVE